MSKASKIQLQLLKRSILTPGIMWLHSCAKKNRILSLTKTAFIKKKKKKSKACYCNLQLQYFPVFPLFTVFNLRKYPNCTTW